MTLRRSFSAAVAAVWMVGCIEPPLAPSNYFDTASGSRLEVAAQPDTVNSMFENFVIEVRSRPTAPPRTQIAWVSLTPDLIVHVNNGEFRTTLSVGLIPTIARFRAYVSNAPNAPSVVGSVVVRQRPDSAELACSLGSVCESLSGLDATASLSFRLLDENGYPINLPGGDFRFGSVVSRSPAVVAIDSRPGPSLIRVRSVGVGSSWVVLEGDGVRDSLRIEVTP